MRTLIYNDTELLIVLTTECKDTIKANIGTNKSMIVDSTFDISAYEVLDGKVVKRTTKNSVELYQEKQGKLASIVVTTSNGNIFKGDEKSQNRMLNKITEMQTTNTTRVDWKCVNGVISISTTELQEALSLSSKKLSDIILGVN